MTRSSRQTLGNAKYFTSDHMVKYEWAVDATYREVFACVRSVDHSEDILSDENICVKVVIHQDGLCMTLDRNMFHHFKVAVCEEEDNSNCHLRWNIVERMHHCYAVANLVIETPKQTQKLYLGNICSAAQSFCKEVQRLIQVNSCTHEEKCLRLGLPVTQITMRQETDVGTFSLMLDGPIYISFKDKTMLTMDSKTKELETVLPNADISSMLLNLLIGSIDLQKNGE